MSNLDILNFDILHEIHTSIVLRGASSMLMMIFLVPADLGYLTECPAVSAAMHGWKPFRKGSPWQETRKLETMINQGEHPDRINWKPIGMINQGGSQEA